MAVAAREDVEEEATETNAVDARSVPRDLNVPNALNELNVPNALKPIMKLANPEKRVKPVIVENAAVVAVAADGVAVADATGAATAATGRKAEIPLPVRRRTSLFASNPHPTAMAAMMRHPPAMNQPRNREMHPVPAVKHRLP